MRMGDVMPPRRIPGIPGRVHRNDFMLWPPTSDVVSFYRDGADHALAMFGQALTEVGRDINSVARWLDFGCGYGRVVRYLIRNVDPRRIWVTDVIPGAARFCSREFGVHALDSSRDLANVHLGEFDFVYAISVLTHLNPTDSMEFVRLMSRSLASDGIVVFTTQGQCVVDHIRYAGLPEPVAHQQAAIESELAADGLSYVPYEYYRDDYGVTFHTRDWVETTVRSTSGGELQLVSFTPGVMPFAQDTYVFQRRP